MLKDILVNLYERDLQKLKKEINLYKTDEDLWKIDGTITNSGGNLCLHLIGNLKTFLGAILGKTGFIRDRDAEFSSKNVTRSLLLHELENTAEIVSKTLRNLTDADLETDFPQKYEDQTVKTGWMLTHLSTHLNYHLGQINYHRRFFS